MTLSRLFLTWFSQLQCNIYCYISMSHDIIYVKQYKHIYNIFITYKICQRWYHIKCHIFQQNELIATEGWLSAMRKVMSTICHHFDKKIFIYSMRRDWKRKIIIFQNIQKSFFIFCICGYKRPLFIKGQLH